MKLLSWAVPPSREQKGSQPSLMGVNVSEDVKWPPCTLPPGWGCTHANSSFWQRLRSSKHNELLLLLLWVNTRLHVCFRGVYPRFWTDVWAVCWAWSQKPHVHIYPDQSSITLLSVPTLNPWSVHTSRPLEVCSGVWHRGITCDSHLW